MMEPWQERVLAEQDELDDRLAKLESFMLTDQFAKLSWEDREDMRDQAQHMTLYRSVLRRRISRFPMS